MTYAELNLPGWAFDLLTDLDPEATLISAKTKPAGTNTRPASSPDKLARRVRKWIEAGPAAVSGQGGHDRTFEVAQALVNGFCLSRAEAIDAMMTHFVPMSPPDDLWSLKEIEHKVEDAIRKPCGKPRGWLLDAENPNAKAVSSPVGHRHTAPTSRTGLPTIVQQPAQLRDVVDATFDAIVKANDPFTTFLHGTNLVRIESTDVPGVRTLTKPQIRLLMSQAANFVSESTNKEGEPVYRDAFPKNEVVESVAESETKPGIPRLTSVTDVPVITSESGLLTKPGFDAASGVYLLPGGYASVPEVAVAPTEGDVAKARQLLLEELLGDFPFVDDASRANALALFLLPFVRGLINGPTPLHLIDAPQEGTGKSLLIKTWGNVCEGRAPKAMTEVSRPDDWQKLILSALLESPRSIYLDNINHGLDASALCAAITEQPFSGRLLGFSRIVSVPVNCVWVATGNNVGMSREMLRRTIYIRLDAKRDVTWTNRKFRHPLPGWAHLNRGELVWACLTICQAWVAKGKPKGRELLGTFEEWSKAIDGILCNAGITDLAGNADAFRAATVDSTDEWRAFVPVWWDEYQDMLVTPGELAKLADNKEMLCAMLEKAITDRAKGTKVGVELKKVRDRIYNGRKVEFAGTNRNHQAQYRLVSTDGIEPVVKLELDTI